MLQIFACLLLVTTRASLEDVLFNQCNIKEAIKMPPESSIDMTYKYFLHKRFRNDSKTGILYLMSSDQEELDSMLLLARVGSDSTVIRVSQTNLVQLFTKLGAHISKKYMENRYNYYEMPLIYMKNDKEMGDTITNIWTLDTKIQEKFFWYIYKNKIALADVKTELDFLAKKNNPKAFGMLGDIYFYGLKVPVDRDRALEYYMAGRELNDPHSFIGLGKILAAEPYNDFEGAKDAFDRAIKLNADSEAYYMRYLIHNEEAKNIAGENAKLVAKKQGAGLLYASAQGGYLPAVYAFSIENIHLNLLDNAIFSFMSITQYAPLILETSKKAIKAYENKEYKKSLLYFLYLSEFKVRQATKNAIYLLENFKLLKNQDAILFDLYKEMAVKNKKYYLEIGDCYYYGRGVEKSLEYAFAYYMSSSSIVDESLYNVAYMYENGQGVPRNLRLAYKNIFRRYTNKSSYLVFFYGKIRIGFLLICGRYFISLLVGGLAVISVFCMLTRVITK